MKASTIMIITLIITPFSVSLAESSSVDQLLQEYTAKGAGPANPEHGKQLWQKTSINRERSCATCHTADLTKNGSHILTNE
ncbi:MAG: DUF1924 domain-containing protein [Xanthomonadales bacterium]|nr:DUF1924 domain-containing protein [Xanthomonadales bacterium]